MTTTLLPVVSISVLVSAVITISGHYLHPPRRLLIGIFKPLTTILILAVALLPGSLASEPYTRAIAVGLVFSLIGDVLLVLPDRFLQGLVAFLFAQIAYIIAFQGGARAGAFPWVLLGVALIAAGMLWYLWQAAGPKLRLPIAVYIVMIELMTALAVSRALGQPSTATVAAAVGATLFMCSDAMLAINRFRRPFRLAELSVLSTYFAAQLLIAHSV